MSETFLRKIFRPKSHRLFFPGQEKGEKVIFFTRRHPLSFLSQFLFAFFMAVMPFLFYLLVNTTGIIDLSVIGAKVMIVFGSSYLLFVLGFFLAAWIDYYLDVMILTDFRIIDITQNVLFSRTVAEANLTDIEDVNAEVKGVLPTFFHYGTVFVQTAGTARNFEFKSIPNPYDISKMVVDLHQQSLLEEEERETEEIGRSLAKRRDNGEEVTDKDVHQAAHNLTKHNWPTDAAPKRESDYLEPQQEQREPKEGSKFEPKNDDENISQDDLRKGGEAEF